VLSRCNFFARFTRRGGLTLEDHRIKAAPVDEWVP